MNRNFKLKISYDGSRYYGWEHQPDQVTIQGKLENVISKMLDIDVGDFKIIGAGRTDAGVHAKAMIANVVLDTDMSPEAIRDYMNRYLPDDIAVLDVREAAERFHARYNAVGKTYRYTCFDGPVKPVFDRKYYVALDEPLDIEKMQQAAEYLVGKHDYKSFCGNSRMKKSTVRVVDKIEIVRKRGYVYMTFHGTGFLQNMVRILAGTLMEVGYGRMEQEYMADILEAMDRKLPGPTAPAKGLV